jgi:hypothetical protein
MFFPTFAPKRQLPFIVGPHPNFHSDDPLSRQWRLQPLASVLCVVLPPVRFGGVRMCQVSGNYSWHVYRFVFPTCADVALDDG